MSDPAHWNQPPRITVPPPGPQSRRLARRLASVESRNVTSLGDHFPIFWEKARGSNVWDADGNRYVDLTAGFGVAVSGHRDRRVMSALRRQIALLPHGMGDVHPPALKVKLLERLAAVSPIPDPRIVLTCSGAEAVEVALKTTRLATGKPGMVVFTGAYHGLTYGALAGTDRELFRGPFEDQLNPHVSRAPYPHPYRPPAGLVDGPLRETSEASIAAAALASLRVLLESAGGADIGAVLVEPIQGRGGDVVPPPGFLSGVAEICADRGLLLIADEVYTGLGRTGRWFACEHEDVTPDLLCVGKALSGTLPIAACIGSREAMDAWPTSSGEAIHTSTFLGNPLACAAAIASLTEIRRHGLVERAADEGERWIDRLRERLGRHPAVGDVRGRGLMIGIDLVREESTREPHTELAGRVVAGALRRGWIVLAGAPDGNVISLSPPLTLSAKLMDAATDMLDAVLEESLEPA
jgi:4-aminobutyrate aminotransferase-like enzyme